MPTIDESEIDSRQNDPALQMLGILALTLGDVRLEQTHITESGRLETLRWYEKKTEVARLLRAKLRPESLGKYSALLEMLETDPFASVEVTVTVT